MIRKVLRELYLLPRGEQRAMILLSLLLILGLGIRVVVQVMPGREPPGMEQFLKESREVMGALAEVDSLNKVSALQREKVSQHPPGHQKKSGDYTIRHRSSPPVVSSFNPININRADSVGLLPLPGIGPVFAGRIIRYRNLLGGYKKIDQLYEVYGLKGATIRVISAYLIIDTTAIRKIVVDSASFRDLLRHPYLQLENVKALVNYRDFRGHIDSIEEVIENNLLPDSTLERIGPYLQFNH